MVHKSVLEFIKSEKLDFVDVKFIDLPGKWQHFTVPSAMFDEGSFEAGLGFDGSSIRGFQDINESDMLLMPDASTARVDPFFNKTLSIIADVKDPETGKWYSRDPRYIAKKAEKHLLDSGIADTAYFGPEAEFFIFDDVRYGQNEFSAFHYIDSDEGAWNSGRKEGDGCCGQSRNPGYKIGHKEGYFPVPPNDSQQDIRSEMVLAMQSMGLDIEAHHHEVASGGQAEIDIRFDSLLSMADKVMTYKYVVKNVASKHGKTATFMPKPMFSDNGSGMHSHQSLWKNGKNLFYDPKGYAGLSEMALHYIGGILKHAPALCAFIAPTTNSYKRLVPGFEAPVILIYSKRNRSAAIRIPMYSQSEKAKRIEFRTPDPSCNPYLAFSAMLMAGLDGVKNKIEPGHSLDKDLYDLEADEAKSLKTVPSSLNEALDALEQDHKFLLEGNVFTKDLIDMWIAFKRVNDVDAIRLRPHPWEFKLYYDV
ncbi:MAG: type I glutamate--ammonia ligase [Candidatus Diapherotrites archaeon]|nr:type I glutamate--ammonia ligase [Candidatus Diapherotrites archaeon]